MADSKKPLDRRQLLFAGGLGALALGSVAAGNGNAYGRGGKTASTGTTVTTTAPTTTTTTTTTTTSSGRPTGTEYVAIESLGVPLTGEGLRQALTKPGNGKILTLPAGDFVAPNWNTSNKSVWNVPSGWRGIVGSGQSTRLTFPSGGLAKPSDVPTTSGSTNPYHTVQAIDGANFAEFGNLSLVGNAGHHHGGIRIRNTQSGVRVKIWKIWLDNCAPGNYWAPPGETFGINTWHVGEYGGGCDVSDIWGDGRNNCSSLLGFNDTHNVTVRRAHFQNISWGMPTWWKCRNIDTDGITSLGGHAGLNMENVGGVIIHRNTVMKPNRDWPTAGANRNAMHTTFQSSMSEFVADRLEFHDFTVDTGIRGGCLTLMSSLNYFGTTQRQNLDRVHVYRRNSSGVEYELTRQNTWVSGNAAPDPTKYWYAFR